ncbi:MAG: hypothetical protein MZW92_75085 [Comamonadaceae bacterium]|nr:hypothetical protein [Comamonadaceae bacterium]
MLDAPRRRPLRAGAPVRREEQGAGRQGRRAAGGQAPRRGQQGPRRRRGVHRGGRRLPRRARSGAALAAGGTALRRTGAAAPAPRAAPGIGVKRPREGEPRSPRSRGAVVTACSPRPQHGYRRSVAACREGRPEMPAATPLRSLRRLLAAGCLAALAALASALPPEVQVGGPEIIDHEFDWARDGVYCPSCNFGAGNSRLAYIDRDHNLWVGYVDWYSGSFMPWDGKAKLVDTNTVAPVEIGNGPEWMVSARGSELVYSRWTDGVPRSVSALTLGYARPSGQSPSGWAAGSVEGTQLRVMPVGTMDLADATPSVHYQNVGIGNVPAAIYWRDVVKGAAPEVKLPFTNKDPGMTRRWIPGTRDIIVTAPALHPDSGVAYKQVFIYSSVTGQKQQLTFDPEHKLWAFMWKAPEFGGENVFFVMVGGTRVDVYRNLPRADGTSRWRVVHSISGPPSMPYISSPEPFVHNGQSWVLFSTSANPDLHDFVPSAIAVASADPARPELRVLTSDDNPVRARRDPEYFITANGPYFYYNRYVLAADGKPANEGIFRVDSGLGPPIP